MLAKYLRIAGALALFLLGAICVFSQPHHSQVDKGGPATAATSAVPPPALSHEDLLELENIELQMQILQMKYNEKMGQINAEHPGFFFNGFSHRLEPLPTKAPDAQKAK